MILWSVLNHTVNRRNQTSFGSTKICGVFFLQLIPWWHKNIRKVPGASSVAVEAFWHRPQVPGTWWVFNPRSFRVVSWKDPKWLWKQTKDPKLSFLQESFLIIYFLRFVCHVFFLESICIVARCHSLGWCFVDFIFLFGPRLTDCPMDCLSFFRFVDC